MTIIHDFDETDLARANVTFRSVVTDIVKEPLDETLEAVQGESRAIQKLLTEQRRFLRQALGEATLPEIKDQLEQLIASIDDIEAQHISERQLAWTRMSELLANIESRAADLATSRHLEITGRAGDLSSAVDGLNSGLGDAQRQIDLMKRLIVAIFIMCLIITGGVVAALVI